MRFPRGPQCGDPGHWQALTWMQTGEEKRPPPFPKAYLINSPSPAVQSKVGHWSARILRSSDFVRIVKPTKAGPKRFAHHGCLPISRVADGQDLTIQNTAFRVESQGRGTKRAGITGGRETIDDEQGSELETVSQMGRCGSNTV
ncbi:hypothetical protein V2G26_000993 [Clonostachys chloroleuca]